MKNTKCSFIFLFISFLLFFCGNSVAKEVLMVPVVIDGQTVKLEMIIYKPENSISPLATLVLNHGSTGYGRNPSDFKRKVEYFYPLIEFFVDRGWAVIVPMRRGRGGSEGLYDEGFHENRRNGYTCETKRSLKGAERALTDINASMNAIMQMPFVDKQRLVIGGSSRGALTSLAHAALHPENIKGVINFVGGWVAEGCIDADKTNGALFKIAASSTVPSLWLYGDNDYFYSLQYSRQNFNNFLSWGGKGEFHEIELAEGVNGHSIDLFPKKWSLLMDSYLKSLKL